MCVLRHTEIRALSLYQLCFVPVAFFFLPVCLYIIYIPNGFRVTGVLTWLLLGPWTVKTSIWCVYFVMLSVNVVSP
jgi:hypothetical protein